MDFNEYFKRTGVQKKWFAEKVGIAPAQFYQICAEKLPPPVKYWNRIMSVSEGKITLKDLAELAMKNRKNLPVNTID